jgi:hypothetical protein
MPGTGGLMGDVDQCRSRANRRLLGLVLCSQKRLAHWITLQQVLRSGWAHPDCAARCGMCLARGARRSTEA